MRGVAASLLALTWLSACGAMLRTATEAGVAGSVDALADPKTQENVEDIATSEELQASTRALTTSVTRGVVQGLQQELSGPELVTSIGERTEALMRNDVAPGVAAVVRETLDTTLREAASDESLTRTRKVVAATTQAAVDGMALGLSDGIRADIAPALQQAAVQMPALATGLLADEELRRAVGGMVRVVSREFLLGSEAALDMIDKKQDPQADGSFFNGLLGPIGVGWAALVALVGGLAITLVTLVILVLKGNAQRRHLEHDGRRREEMLLALMQSIAGNRGALSAEQPAEAERLALEEEDAGREPRQRAGAAG